MLRHAAMICFSCALLLVGACASAPEGPPVEEKPPAPPPKPKEQRPIYHAESDAISFKFGESKALVEASCAGVDDAAACRDAAGSNVRGYRGSFHRAGAEQLLVAIGDTAVLLSQADGAWRATARAPQVDIRHCVRTKTSEERAADALVCRAPAVSERAFGLAFFHVSVDGDGRIQTETLDVPHARDVGTALFAGWKRVGSAVEVRFHSEEEVTGASQLDFGGSESCRFRTFRYEAGPGGKFVELDDCNDRQYAEPVEDAPKTMRGERAYESRLREPIMNHNREYSSCYVRELESLAKQAEQAREDGGRADRGDRGERADAADQRLSGDIEARFVIGSAGAPVSCEIIETTLDNEHVESCLCREIMDTPFPPVPRGKFVDVTYPFGFSP